MDDRTDNRTGQDSSLPLKYQKLLAEFSKLRNQVVHLTRSLTDEQKEKEQLHDVLKEKDKQIKKFQQETENIQFRNQQLTRRVSVLQEELKTKTPVRVDDLLEGQSTFSIFDAELTSKIKEVAELNEKISLLQAENLGLREDNHELHLQQSDSSFMIRAQEEVIQQQKMIIDELSQKKHDEAHPAASSSVTSTASTGQGFRDQNGEGDVMDDAEASSLRATLEAADSKASLFSNECHRLKQRLIIAIEQKDAAIRELNEVKDSLQQAKDELTTSVRNYETQLETMSEHLATMTEKWSKEEIEREARQGNHSGKKNKT